MAAFFFACAGLIASTIEKRIIFLLPRVSRVISMQNCMTRVRNETGKPGAAQIRYARTPEPQGGHPLETPPSRFGTIVGAG
jgi:hypothetical protein